MINITIAELGEFEGNFYWTCWLELTQNGETLPLPTTAPGDLQESELQAYFDAQEAELWEVAQEKQHSPDIFEHIASRRVLKAFVAVAMEEINMLRDLHGLAPRTMQQLRNAIKQKLSISE